MAEPIEAYGKSNGAGPPALDLDELLDLSGLPALNDDSTAHDEESAMRRFVASLAGADALQLERGRRMAERVLADRKIPHAGRYVAAAFKAVLPSAPTATDDDAQGQAVAFADPEPWPEPVDGAALLEDVRAFLARFLGLPPGSDALLAAVTVYTYATDAFAAAPYLVAHSPAPQCGKTRLLEVLALLVRRPWLTIVPSTAVLFRVLEAHAPTLLLDEAEVVRGRGDAAGDVRALLQSGYRRGAFVPRCVGDANEVRNFRVFGPKVFALIGELPAALFDRCIRIEMQRRVRGEQLARFRPAQLESEALTLRRLARRWADDHRDALAAVEVPALDFLDERAEEVWGPLLAVGIVAGSDWYDRLHEAARRLSGGRSTTSAGVELLADVRAVFDARGADRIFSADLAAALAEMEGQPWPEWRAGKPITPTQIAELLGGFRVAPKTVRIGDKRAKGYFREHFAEAWGAYAPSSRDTVTSEQRRDDLAIGSRDMKKAVTARETEKSPPLLGCHGVTAQMQGEAGPGLFDVDVPPPEGWTPVDPDEAARAAMREDGA